MIPVCYDLSQLDGIFLIRCLLVFNQVLFKDLHYGQIDDEKTDTDDQQISKGNPPAQTGKKVLIYLQNNTQLPIW